MRSTVLDVLPPTVKRSLAKLGADLATARRKRGLTIVAEGGARGCWQKALICASKRAIPRLHLASTLWRSSFWASAISSAN